MLRSRSLFAPVVLGLLVAACADVAPIAPTATLMSSSAAIETLIDTGEPGAPWAVYFKPGKASGMVARAEAAGATVNFVNDRFGFAMVTGLDDASAATLRGVSGVEEVALDEVVDMGQRTDAVIDGSPTIASPSAPATAFFYPRQWHLQVIEAKAAWDAGKLGSPDVTVAVIDGGLDWTHPDLAGRVDLSRSASFVPLEDLVVAAFYPGAHPVADLQYHGTHVGATIASNAIAAAGVTSQTTLIGVKVCYGVSGTVNGVPIQAGSCPGVAILAGIAHAIESGANVANMSLGGAFLRRQSKGFVGTVNRLFTAANQAGVVMVVAAGNDASDLDKHQFRGVTYPSLYKSYCDAPNVLCVSATGPTAGATNGPWTNIDALAGYSNYGRSVISVAAPGGNWNPVTAACSKFTLVTALAACRGGTFVVGLNGTSMAAPHVSGLAALIAAEGVTQPSQIRARIRQGADDLGQRGTDPFYGAGRINVRRSLGL